MADLTSAVTLDEVCRLLTDLRDLLRDQFRPVSELLTRDDLAGLLNVGLSTLDRLKAAGKIGPRPAELAGLKWHRPEVLGWLAHRDPSGELFDSASWPAVWTALQAQARGTRR